jgi:membrane-associated phospholipid phosphatase
MNGDIRQKLSSTSDRRPSDCSSCATAALIVMGLALIPVILFNRSLFLIINGLHTPVTDWMWLAFTTLGDGLLVGIILGAFLLVNPRVTVFGIALLILSSVLVHIVKLGFPSLRPVMLLDSVHVVGPLLRGGSFPSGHSAAAMSAGLAVARFVSSRTMARGAIVAAVLVSLSRIFVGAHFPEDVLGGIICATLVFVMLDRLIWPRIKERIPASPAFAAPAFRLAFYAEILASLYAVSVYAYYFAETPLVCGLSAFSILVFLGVGYAKLPSAPG